MLVKTKGIVLGVTKYKETSIIAKVYTEELGIQSYLVNGVRAKKGRIGIALFQPLTIIDSVIYHSDKKTIHRVSEIKCHFPYSSIPYDIKKSTISIFMAEWLNKTLRAYEEQDRNLYEFLENKLISLDQSEGHIENFHIHFILELTRFLGVLPEGVTDFPEDNFSQAGAGMPEKLGLQSFLDGEDAVPLKSETRRKLLAVLANYYRHHLGHFGELKSIAVLHDVLS